MYNLITDPQYKLPLLAPDGNYCPNASSISEINTDKELIRITDLLGRRIQKGTKNQLFFYIFDDGTVEKRIIIN